MWYCWFCIHFRRISFLLLTIEIFLCKSGVKISNARSVATSLRVSSSYLCILNWRTSRSKSKLSKWTNRRASPLPDPVWPSAAKRTESDDSNPARNATKSAEITGSWRFTRDRNTKQKSQSRRKKFIPRSSTESMFIIITRHLG